MLFISFLENILNKIYLIINQICSYIRIKYKTKNILKKIGDNNQSKYSLLSINEIETVLSFKITNHERIKIFKYIISSLGNSVESVKINIIYSTNKDYFKLINDILIEAKLDITYKNLQISLIQSYLYLLESIKTKYFYLQFDDQLTIGLSENFLIASESFLEKYKGIVDVICILPPNSIKIDNNLKEITVNSYDKIKSKYKFIYTNNPITPIYIDKINNYEFAIFENFQYGFFFNHLIAPVEDYLTRMRWYMNNISTTSAHDIEIKASNKSVGPYWTHLAVCLSDICYLDLDYSHTNESLRANEKINKDIFDALKKGI